MCDDNKIINFNGALTLLNSPVFSSGVAPNRIWTVSAGTYTFVSVEQKINGFPYDITDVSVGDLYIDSGRNRFRVVEKQGTFTVFLKIQEEQLQ